MSNETVTRSSGNVYADLGFPDAEAMLKKSELLVIVRDLMAVSKTPPETLAGLLGYDLHQMEGILRGRFSDQTVDEMVGWVRLLTDRVGRAEA